MCARAATCWKSAVVRAARRSTLPRTRGCRVTGVDINEHGVRNGERLAAALGLAERVTFQAVDAARPLPFPAATFDAILCNDAMCHIANRLDVLRDWYRVLRPGGRILFSDAMVITGLVSQEELAVRSSIGFYFFLPPGENDRLIARAGFTLLASEDTTATAEMIAQRWRAARERHRPSWLRARARRTSPACSVFWIASTAFRRNAGCRGSAISPRSRWCESQQPRGPLMSEASEFSSPSNDNPPGGPVLPGRDRDRRRGRRTAAASARRASRPWRRTDSKTRRSGCARRWATPRTAFSAGHTCSGSSPKIPFATAVSRRTSRMIIRLIAAAARKNNAVYAAGSTRYDLATGVLVRSRGRRPAAAADDRRTRSTRAPHRRRIRTMPS